MMLSRILSYLSLCSSSSGVSQECLCCCSNILAKMVTGVAHPKGQILLMNPEVHCVWIPCY